ncbi:MAG: NAD(P)H-quinone oxidoreductase [Gammaproteobacteria bacterium]|nr:NAD(P)H-quinone oxidoreductase [Gammaproteobacteria bacterium]
MTSSIPEQMTAIGIAEPGGPEVLRPVTLATPRPGKEQVLIKVAAAGVNRPDVMQRKGMYPPPPGAPETPGLEIAGEVVALGDGAADLSPGDRVCALVTGGGYAEYCVAAASLCLPYPDGMEAVQAAALPETFFTVWTNVFDRGRLTEGERFLVHGGTSGIGTTAIQLARAFGATVFATAGSAEKCRACEELGADAAINYREEDFVERIGELTEGRGVDLILDMVAGDYLPRNLKCLATDGRLVQIALQKGPKVEMNLLPVMLNRLTITGSTLRPRSVSEKAGIAASLRKRVWPLLSQGKVAPVIHETFPLARAADAHALMESSRHIGKILLTV